MPREGGRRSSRPRVGGSGPYDELIAIFTDIVRQEVQAVMPRLATVKGLDGQGKHVRVTPWGEEDTDDEREESRPRVGGKNKKGDLVLLFPVGGGNEVAVGPIINTQRANREQIDGDDIERDAIEERHIRQNAIKGVHLQGGAIGQRELGQNSVNRAALVGSLGAEIGGKVDRSAFDTKMRNVDNHIDRLFDRLHNLDNKGKRPQTGGQGQGPGN